jgi:glutamate synthase (NADPH/NADH) small chain
MSTNPLSFDLSDRQTRMKLPSRGLPERPPEERSRDFNEVYLPVDESWAIYEASRCIQCEQPAACQLACPAHNDIPRAMELIARGNFLAAAGVYRQTNSLPEICGRVCPQERLCNGACVRCKTGDPVLTGALEFFVTDYERRVQGVKIPVGSTSGHKVAIVGAGPSGLACADQLLRMGHWVTIFEARAAPGGALSYGFPNYKVPHTLVNEIWNSLAEAGATFVGHTLIGKKKTVNDLFAEGFDAVFLGVGSGIDAPLNLPGEDLPGVYKATDFLVRANAERRNLPPRQRAGLHVGSNVVVIGGGDPATDCARTAIRLEAEHVTCLYAYTEAEIPGRAKDRRLAAEEGVHFDYLVRPINLITGADGSLAGIECERINLSDPDDEGHRHPVEIPDSTFTIAAETVIAALGYYPDPIITATTPGLRTQKWGLMIADRETGATSRFGLFTGGDAVTGPDLVVNAMVAGRKAASTIDAYLI